VSDRIKRPILLDVSLSSPPSNNGVLNFSPFPLPIVFRSTLLRCRSLALTPHSRLCFIGSSPPFRISSFGEILGLRFFLLSACRSLLNSWGFGIVFPVSYTSSFAPGRRNSLFNSLVGLLHSLNRYHSSSIDPLARGDGLDRDAYSPQGLA